MHIQYKDLEYQLIKLANIYEMYTIYVYIFMFMYVHIYKYLKRKRNVRPGNKSTKSL